jgi:hypothetical protein
MFPAFNALWQYPVVLLVKVRCREGKAFRSRGQNLIRIVTKFFSVWVLGNVLLIFASSHSCSGLRDTHDHIFLSHGSGCIRSSVVYQSAAHTPVAKQ